MYVISEKVLITAVITSTFGHHHVSLQGGSNEVTNTKVNTPGGDSHMKQTGMLVGNFEFNP